MPNLKDELAALRAKGSVKSHAAGLSGGASLSTPEAEAAASKAKSEKAKSGDIEAKQTLNKGSHAAVQASVAQDNQYTARKREDMMMKRQASEILSKGGSRGAYGQEMERAMNQTGKKKADAEKKNETKRSMASSGSNDAKDDGAKDVAATQADKKSSGSVAVVTKAEVETGAAKEEAAPAPVEIADDDADDDVPELEEVDSAVPEKNPTAKATRQTEPIAAAAEEEERQITNRNEKKARKMMTRLGMRPVSNIARVTLKAGGGRGYFFIDRPDVYASAGGKSDTYVIFGEAKQGGAGAAGGGGGNDAARQQAAMAQRAAMAARQTAAAAGAGGAEATPGAREADDDAGVPDPVADEGGGAAEEEGVEAKDVDLVMSQASCSRAKAVAALKENDGDLVNAIMSLTT